MRDPTALEIVHIFNDNNKLVCRAVSQLLKIGHFDDRFFRAPEETFPVPEFEEE